MFYNENTELVTAIFSERERNKDLSKIEVVKIDKIVGKSMRQEINCDFIRNEFF